jgi:regulator of protease activity HflC (stomatin/prohibitin superfamily)
VALVIVVIAVIVAVIVAAVRAVRAVRVMIIVRIGRRARRLGGERNAVFVFGHHGVLAMVPSDDRSSSWWAG